MKTQTLTLTQFENEIKLYNITSEMKSELISLLKEIHYIAYELDICIPNFNYVFYKLCRFKQYKEVFTYLDITDYVTDNEYEQWVKICRIFKNKQEKEIRTNSDNIMLYLSLNLQFPNHIINIISDLIYIQLKIQNNWQGLATELEI
jgi:hypothetical protein